MRIIYLFCLLFSVTTLADELCDNKKMLSSTLYTQFLGVQHTLEYPYSVLYHEVSDSFGKAFDTACTKNKVGYDLIGELHSSCGKSCTNGVKSYFTGALEQTEKKQKKLKSECENICISSILGLRLYQASLDENPCHSAVVLKVNGSRDIKDVSDKLRKQYLKQEKEQKSY